jgi:hypothetical protein
MFCKQCGKEVAGDGKFCQSCGAPVLDVNINQPTQESDSPPVATISRPRIWVIIFAIILCLTIIGLIIGIPLLVTELKRRPAGMRPKNNGWIVAGVICFILFIIAVANTKDDKTKKSNNPSASPAIASSQSGKTETASDPARNEESAEKQPEGDEESKDSINKKDEPVSTTNESGGYKVGDVVQLRNHQFTVTQVVPNYKTGNQFDKPQSDANMFVKVHVVIKNTGNSDLLVNMFGFQLEDETGTMRTVDMIMGLDNQLESVTLVKGGQIEGNIGFEAKQNSKVLKLHYTGGFLGGEEIVDLLAK